MAVSRHKQSGMTLVELLVAMAILGLAMTGIYSVFSTHNRMAAVQEETTRMQQELLTSVVQISDNIRVGGYAPNGGSFGFRNLPGTGNPDYGRTTNGTALYCTWDANGNGILDENATENENIAYRLNVNNDGSERTPRDNILRRYSSGQWQTVATGIGNLQFEYFDADGVLINNPQANLNKIRNIRLTVTAVASSLRAGLNIGNRTMTTTVLCRNVR